VATLATFGEDRGYIANKVGSGGGKTKNGTRQDKAHKDIIWEMQSTLGRIVLVLLLVIAATAAVSAWLYQQRGAGLLNPQQGLTMIERLLIANRDLELIEWQPRAELIRTRHLSSGREILFTYRDVAGRRTAVGFEEYPADHQPDPQIPSWVPLYPGAQVVTSKHEGASGELMLAVAAPLAKALDYYKTGIRAEGMSVAVEKLSDNESMVRGVSRDGRTRISAKLMVRPQGTNVRLEYQGT
jgi:hypothetical protein